MSGLSRTPGKRVWVNPHRGFESRPLRQSAKASQASSFARPFACAVPVAQLTFTSTLTRHIRRLHGHRRQGIHRHGRRFGLG